MTQHTLPDGEDAKRFDVVESVYRVLNRASFTRGDLVIAVGGGALTDVAGFAAGTYLRGVPAIYVPTTLVEARELLASSAVARAAFGDEVVDHYVNAADVEITALHAAVTDWERVRGFERL